MKANKVNFILANIKNNLKIEIMKKEEQKPSKPLAFPGVDENTGAYVDGMTLRDYFAAKAMQSIISSSNYDNFAGNNGMLVPEFVAKEAYQIADAMLKQRGL